MSDYRKQIETTEELAEWYSNKYSEMGDGWITPPEECNRHLDDLSVPYDLRGVMLLDVGCGAGHFLMEAQKRVAATGIDISEEGIRLCLKRGVNAYRASIEDLIPAEHYFRYDYIVSLGSLEHIVDLGMALDNIRGLLKPNGKFYFFCPNEQWMHFDQPNERTMTDAEWTDLFATHGLYVHSKKRWNDNTAFIGQRGEPREDHNVEPRTLPPNGNKLNIGSGQRRFDNANGWINIDCVSRPGQVPDLVCDCNGIPYPDNSMEISVLHQVYEHFGLGEGHGIVREIYRTLKPGGSLIVTVPDMRALAERWLSNQMSDYLYFSSMYGAYQGLEGDRHKWGYTGRSLNISLREATSWNRIVPFDWRSIPGADIAKDWWILGVEAIK